MIDFLTCFLSLFWLMAPAAPMANRAALPSHPRAADSPMMDDRDGRPHFQGGAGKSAPRSMPAEQSAVGLPQFVDFGWGAAGYCKDTVFTDTNVAGGEVTGIVDHDLGFTLTIGDDFSPLPNSPYTVHISYCPTEPGEHTDTIIVNLSRGTPRLIVLRGRARGAELPFDSALVVDMRTIPVGKAVDTATVIGVVGIDSMRIDSIFFEEPDAPYQCIQPGPFPRLLHSSGTAVDSIVVRAVKFTPSLQDSGTMVIRTDMGTRRITFIASFIDTSAWVDTGGVYVVGDTIEFGNVELGSCAERSMTIINTTRTAVSLDSLVWFPGDMFSQVAVAPRSDSIPSMDSVVVRIRFCPRFAGGASSNGRVWAGGRMVKEIVLIGFGVFPSVGAQPDTVDLGMLEAGNCIDTVIRVTRSDSGRWEQPEFDSIPGLTIRTNPPLPAEFGDDDSLTVIISFCPPIGNDSTQKLSTNFFVRIKGARTHILSILATVLPKIITPRAELRFEHPGDTLISFNEVDSGTCVTRSITVVNAGTAPATIDSMTFDAGSDAAFTLLNPPGRPHTLGVGEKLTFTVQFCPRRVAALEGVLEIWGNEGRKLIAYLRGRGRAVVMPEEPVLRLADASARVGEPFRLSLQIDGIVPANTTLDHLRLIFNRRSLWFRSAIPASGGGTLSTLLENDSTLLVIGNNAPVGNAILDFEFIGLSTGQEQNSVRIGEIVLRNLPAIRLDTATVILSGCTFIEGGLFTKKIAIKGITADPLSSSVGIFYDAPNGMRPSLSLIAVSGERIVWRELPYGNGAEQRAQVSVNDLAPGLYLLELRVGNDRTSVPIMVGR